MTQDKAPRRDDYAPYHTFDEFQEGVADYTLQSYQNPYGGGFHELSAQAWDRGQEYAIRMARFHHRLK
jgi:hypothetical protein